jgi:hypothetical protein
MLKFTVKYENKQIIVLTEKEGRYVRSGKSMSSEDISEIKRFLCKEVEIFYNNAKSIS